MEFKKKPLSSPPVVQSPKVVTQAVTVQPIDPVVQRQAEVRHNLQKQTFRPASVQRQVMQPALRAASLYGGEVQRLATERQILQREAAALGPISLEAMTQAIQRQQKEVPQIPIKPQSVGDWVTVMRFQAEQAQGRRMGAKEAAQYTALQRQVANTIAQNFRQDRQPASVRYEQYAGHLATLQGGVGSAIVANAALSLMPASERPAMQRALDEALQREAVQQAQHQAALKLHSLQRQMAELEQEATQPVFERIQQRRGAGTPLPEAIQRHLEQGLNHDLSAVRIHDDAEADKMAKGVNALAFTTGTDIYFQSGKFNPNSQSGLELLAHEVTHTVQQSKGQVGKGVDPDAGLESEARAIGRKLSRAPFTTGRHIRTASAQTARVTGALQRFSTNSPTPSRSWENKHDFGGHLQASHSELAFSISEFRVLQKGVVVGRFSTESGKGRLDGFMDSRGSVYWTAKYESGILVGKQRKFHGKVQQDTKGVPTSVQGKWEGQDAQGNTSTYTLLAKHQEAPAPDSNQSGSGSNAEGLQAVRTIVLMGKYAGDTGKLSLTIYPNGEVIGYFADVLDTPQQAYYHKGDYLEILSGKLINGVLNFETKKGKSFSGKFEKSGNSYIIKGNSFDFMQSGAEIQGAAHGLNDSVKPRTTTYQASANAARLIRGQEGFRARPYDDGVGYWTIGYGHRMTASELTRFKQIGNAYVITESEAMQLYNQDAKEKVDDVNKVLKIEITQAQFDSLLSLSYNAGSLGNLDLIDRLNAAKTHKEVNIIMLEELPRVFKAKDQNDLNKNGNTQERIGLRGLVNRRGEELTNAIGGVGNKTTTTPTHTPPDAQPPTPDTNSNYSTTIYYPMKEIRSGDTVVKNEGLANRLTSLRGQNYDVGTILIPTAEFTAINNGKPLNQNDYYGGYNVHTGWDLNWGNTATADRGMDIYSISDGIVKFAGTGSMGNTVIIHHPQLHVYSRYGHLLAISVGAGQTVKGGKTIGKLGGSGPQYNNKREIVSVKQNVFPNHLHIDFIKEDAEAVKLRNKLDIWEGSSVESVLKNYEDPYKFLKGAIYVK